MEVPGVGPEVEERIADDGFEGILVLLELLAVYVVDRKEEIISFFHLEGEL